MTQMTLSPFEQTIVANGSNDLNSSDPTGAGGAPLAPSGFTATYLSDTSLSLAWTDNSSTELNFEIDRRPNGTDPWTPLADPAANATSATNTGLTVDTTYYYRLRAVNAAGNSAYVTASGTTTAGVTSTANLLIEDFESENLTLSAAPLNVNNFAWTSENRTGIVSQSGATAHRVYPVIYDEYFNDGRDWTAKEGTWCMSFEYAAGINNAEQYYTMDTIADVWVRYWIRVPPNFSHGTMNNKFFVIFGSTYDQGGDLTLETRPTAGGSCEIYMKDGGAGAPDEGNTPFIDVATDLNRWMQVVVHVVNGSGDGVADGVIEFYRRWDGEANFTQLLNKQNATGLWETGTLGFREGYLMGYANDAYAADTVWLLDNFEMSSGSLI